MKLTTKLLAIPGLLLLASGCNQTSETRSVETTSANETRTEAATAPVAAEVSDPSQAVRAYVRAVHTVRGAGPVALAIDGKTLVEKLAFGEASEFVGLHDPKVKIHATRDHQISVTDADGKTLGGPLSLDLERGEDFTIVVGGAPGKITLTPFEHTNRGSNNDDAKLAVLHADNALPEITLTLDGKAQRNDVGFGEVTKYFILEPGERTLKVQYDKSLVGVADVDKVGQPASPPRPVGVKATGMVTLTQTIKAEAGEVYSVIVFADKNGLPALRLLEDKFRPALIRAPDAAEVDATTPNDKT